MVRELLYNNMFMPLYRNALDAYAARHRSTASNIANAQTPDYEPRRVEFEKQLAAAHNRSHGLKTSDQRHIGLETNMKQVRHTLHLDRKAAQRQEDRGFDVEREMATLLTNQQQFALVAKKAGSSFSAIRKLSNLK